MEHNWSLGESDARGKGYERIKQINFWYKDVIEVIQELFKNPDLQEDMIYTPVKLYTDAMKTERIYNEMWTCDFWHEMAVSSQYKSVVIKS